MFLRRVLFLDDVLEALNVGRENLTSSKLLFEKD